MIVENEKWSLEEATKLANTLSEEIKKFIETFSGPDDASEIIYVMGHATANFFSRICVYFDSIGEAYNIDTSKLKDWMLSIVEGLVKANSKNASKK